MAVSCCVTILTSPDQPSNPPRPTALPTVYPAAPRLRHPFTMAPSPASAADASPTPARPPAPRAPSLLQAASKSAAAPAAVDTENVELRDMVASTPPPELELKDDIMKLAITGDELAIRELLDSGRASATYADGDGITPLHVSYPPPPTITTASAAGGLPPHVVYSGVLMTLSVGSNQQSLCSGEASPGPRRRP